MKIIKSKQDLSEDDNCDLYLIKSSEKEARKIIASLKDRKNKIPVALVGGDDAFNRRAIESLKIDYLVSPEAGIKKDGLKQRDSGLNHVVAKLAEEKGIEIVVDFDSLSKMSGKDKALRLARIIQNVKICRKAGCKIRIWGNVDDKALKSFGVGLGMNSKQSSEATLF